MVLMVKYSEPRQLQILLHKRQLPESLSPDYQRGSIKSHRPPTLNFTMSTPDRQELVRNAVAFLSDPKVLFIQINSNNSFIYFQKTQASPVTQRIQFLEAKGLTPAEIDIALKQASAISVTLPPPQYASSYSNNPYAMPPSPQRWDWRDYFV